MNTRNGALAVLIAALACAAPAAAATKVNVRVEGKTKTIFEGAVNATVHEVDAGDGTGKHKCDGTNGGAGTTAGVTPTSALDDAMKLAGLTWGGSFSADFDDFLVARIGPDEQTDTQFWGVALGGKSLQVGGCQAVVAKGQEVLWAYDSYNKALLQVSGPAKTRVGKLVSFKVVNTDGESPGPVAGAKIAGKTTNAKGIAKVRFKSRGTKRLKATAPKSIRSNQLVVKVRKKK